MDPYYQQQAYYNLSVPPPPIFYPPYLVPLPPPPPVANAVQPVPLFPGINPANLVACGSEVIGSVGYQKTSAYVTTNKLNVLVENLKKMPEKPPVGTKLMDVRSMFLLCAKDEFWSK